MVADVRHGVPLAVIVTTAKDNDSPLLPSLVSKALGLFPWLSPVYAVADRGYDSQANHKYLMDQGIIPVIAIRRKPPGRKTPDDGLIDGIYTHEGVPTCAARVPMEFVRQDPDKGWLYRCAGCHLKGSMRGGVRHCVRGLAQVRLHSLMSVLAYQATVLIALQEGRWASMRWQVPKVA